MPHTPLLVARERDMRITLEHRHFDPKDLQLESLPVCHMSLEDCRKVANLSFSALEEK